MFYMLNQYEIQELKGFFSKQLPTGLKTVVY